VSEDEKIEGRVMGSCKNSQWDVVGKNKVYECEKCGSKSFKRLDHLADESIVSSVNMDEDGGTKKLTEKEKLFDFIKNYRARS
jgi:hypothetical protein